MARSLSLAQDLIRLWALWREPDETLERLRLAFPRWSVGTISSSVGTIVEHRNDISHSTVYLPSPSVGLQPEGERGWR